ncbi:hypothetical protein Tco_0598980 [Tanacetum coccineum]
MLSKFLYQLFELSELRSQSQAKDTVIVKLKEQIKSLNGNVDDRTVKMDMDEIETLNIELEHRVTKLVAENEHLKQTYKQLYDSIKPKRVQSKEQCDTLIKQVNIKSAEISDLNAKLQEQGLVIAALKNELRKLKGKAVDKEAIETHSVVPNVSKDNMEPITPKLLNKRTAHSSYIKHTQEEALVLRDIVEHVKANYPQDSLLESAFRYTKVIQDLLSHISRSCPSINNFGPQLIEVTPRKQDKKVRFTESLTSSENTKTDSTSNIVSNKRVLHSTGVRLSTSASGSQPSGNTRNDRIPQTPSSNSKNKVEAHPRNVKSSLNKRNGTVKVNGSASVQKSKKQDDSDYVCVNSNDCMSSDNLCVSNSLNVVKFRAKPKQNKSKKAIWKPTGKVFTQIGIFGDLLVGPYFIGKCMPLTRITNTNEVPSRKPLVLDSDSPIPVLNWLSKSSLDYDQVAKIMVLETIQIGNVLFQGFITTVPIPPSSTHLYHLRDLTGISPEVIAPILEAVALEHAISTGSPSSTIVDQDAPSPSNYHTTQDNSTRIISHDVEEDNHDIELHIWDLSKLYGMVVKHYEVNPLAGTGLILWGDLHVLFESTTGGSSVEVWNEQKEWVIRSWKLFPFSGVHVLETFTGKILYMFADTPYPLSVSLMKKMLKHKLEVEIDGVGNDMTHAVQLIQFIKNQLASCHFGWFLSSCYGIHCCCWSAQVQVIAAVFVAVSILKLTLPTGRYVVPTGRVIATDSVIVATSGYVVPAAYDISPGRVK